MTFLPQGADAHTGNSQAAAAKRIVSKTLLLNFNEAIIYFNLRAALVSAELALCDCDFSILELLDLF